MKKNYLPIFFKKRYLLILIIFISLLIYLGGCAFYYSEIRSIKKGKHEEIKAIAELKSREILQWKSERLSEAEFFSSNDNFKKGVNDLKSGRNIPNALQYFTSRLSLIKKNHNYKDIYIVTTDNKILFSLDKNFKSPDTTIQNDIYLAAKSKQIIFSDFHFDKSNQAALDFIAPIIYNGNTTALLVFHIDPSIFLYPLIQTWPTPSKTSETIILRKENDSVVYLNHLRFAKVSPLQFRISLNNKNLPAVHAVSGYKGIFEGIDYRGIKVLSNISRLEGTPWCMVTKVDQSEIYAELNFRAAIISVFTISLMLLTGLGLYFISFTHQNKLNKQYQDLLERRVEERTAELKLSQTNLELVNKELETFSYSVSHDLRAPLRAISGFSNQLKDNMGNKNGNGIVDDIIKTTDHMEKLIVDLLEFSKLSKKELSKDLIDMNRLFNDCFNEILSLSPKKDYHFMINNLPEGYGDIILIKQVITNFLSNAVKFTSKNPDAVIKVNGKSDNKANIYSVSDNGVGFNPEYAHKIFNVFQRLHNTNEFEGSGVGLAIVQRIISRHRGSIWAESEPGKGSTFYFSLPQK